MSTIFQTYINVRLMATNGIRLIFTLIFIADCWEVISDQGKNRLDGDLASEADWMTTP